MSSGLTIFLLYLITILMLLFVATIHELGHFAAGLIFKVNVKEISIGIGPKLYQRYTKKGMRVSIKLIPLVAYVLFDSKQLRNIYSDQIDDKNYSFIIKPLQKGKLLLEQTKPWQYLLIMFAGVSINFLAFLILWPCCWAIFNAMGYSLTNPFVNLGMSLKAIGYCIVFKGGEGSNIFVELPDVAQYSNTWGLIMLQVFLLLNLVSAVFNLMPFPPLDGWKIAVKLYEGNGKRKINQKAEEILTLIGCFLMIYIFVSSILVKWIHW